jgi:hypothetical protein
MGEEQPEEIHELDREGTEGHAISSVNKVRKQT